MKYTYCEVNDSRRYLDFLCNLVTTPCAISLSIPGSLWQSKETLSLSGVRDGASISYSLYASMVIRYVTVKLPRYCNMIAGKIGTKALDSLATIKGFFFAGGSISAHCTGRKSAPTIKLCNYRTTLQYSPTSYSPRSPSSALCLPDIFSLHHSPARRT